MAKQQGPAQRPAQNPAQTPRKAAPAPAPASSTRMPSERRPSIFAAGSKDFIFGRQNFILFGIALLMVLAGLAAMTGGAQPNPLEWDDNIAYSARRITLAPLLIVGGFVVAILGIFKKTKTAPAA